MPVPSTRLNEPFVLSITVPIIERNGYGRMPLTISLCPAGARRGQTRPGQYVIHAQMRMICNCIQRPLRCRHGVELKVAKMIEPRRTGDLLLHSVARVLTYVAFAAIAAAAIFIFVMVLEHH